MSKSTEESVKRPLYPKVRVSNAGVIHVRSSDIIESEAGQKQIEALGRILQKKQQDQNK